VTISPKFCSHRPICQLVVTNYSWTGIFLFAITLIPALRPTQTSYTVGTPVRRTEHEIDESPLRSADISNA
jgi:hypothetical protein